MIRLTYQEPNGKFGVVGMNEDNRDRKLYMCVCKLKDYENLGLNPYDIQQLIYKYKDLTEHIKALEKENEPASSANDTSSTNE